MPDTDNADTDNAPPQSDNAPATGGGFKARMTKKIGPLPTWAWGALLVGGVAAFLLLRKRGGGSGDGGETIESPFDFSGGGFGGGGGGSGGGAASDAPTGGGGGSGGGGGDDTTPIGSSSGGTQETARAAQYHPDVTSDYGVARRGTLTETGMTRMQARYSPGGDLLASIERQLAGGQSVSIQTGYNALNNQISQNLIQRGYTSAVVNGQVYAASDPLTFFNSLPSEARTNLARWLAASPPSTSTSTQRAAPVAPPATANPRYIAAPKDFSIF